MDYAQITHIHRTSPNAVSFGFQFQIWFYLRSMMQLSLFIHFLWVRSLSTKIVDGQHTQNYKHPFDHQLFWFHLKPFRMRESRQRAEKMHSLSRLTVFFSPLAKAALTS